MPIVRYKVCASALQPDTTCATLSCAFRHSLHFWSPSVCVLVFPIEAYSLVCRSCCYSSCSPAAVLVGAVFQSDSQASHSSSTCSSVHLSTINFPCHLSLSISAQPLLHRTSFCRVRSQFPWPLMVVGNATLIAILAVVHNYVHHYVDSSITTNFLIVFFSPISFLVINEKCFSARQNTKAKKSKSLLFAWMTWIPLRLYVGRSQKSTILPCNQWI